MEYYNYLDDSMGIEFNDKNQYTICAKAPTHILSVKICDKAYQDPELYSLKLYRDLSKIYMFRDNKLYPKYRNGFPYLSFDSELIHELRADYIGPSCKWAFSFLDGETHDKAGIIADYLLVSHSIGGYVFWPAHKIKTAYTINQVKGGSRLYDRFDITLAELKNYYHTQIDCEKAEYRPAYFKLLYDSFDRYRWFFEGYETFERYVKSMKLEMFLDNNMNVFSLTNSNVSQGYYMLINSTDYAPKNYNQYICNCKTLIQKRTYEILNTL